MIINHMSRRCIRASCYHLISKYGKQQKHLATIAQSLGRNSIKVETSSIGILSMVDRVIDEARKQLPTYTFETITLKDTDFDHNVAMLDSYKIILADVSLFGPYMHHVQNIDWVQADWTGIDELLKHFDTSKKKPCCRFTRFGGYTGTHIAEYVLSNMVNMERRAFHYHDMQKKSYWDSTNSSYRLLKDLSILILGVGSIGKEIARTCKYFGMAVYGLCTQVPEEKYSFVDDYILLQDLPTYLQKSDYICNILPSTPETNCMLSGNILQNCRNRKSIFINVGRGDVIDHESLLNVLDNKWIGGAILDVFNDEPLPKDDELWRKHNVIITPHIAALNFAPEVIGCFKENLKLYEAGEPLKYEFCWERQY